MNIHRVGQLINRHVTCIPPVGTPRTEALGELHDFAYAIVREVKDDKATRSRAVPVIAVVMIALSMAVAFDCMDRMRTSEARVAEIEKKSAAVTKTLEFYIKNFEPKKNLDAVCPAWLFESSPAQAKVRICKGLK
jgi:hypothetical protein